MKIALPKLHATHLITNEEATRLCRSALEQKDREDYAGAQETMSGLWAGVGERPKTEGLHPSVAAEVLLCTGILTGWVGSKIQNSEAQETAKDTDGHRAYLEAVEGAFGMDCDYAMLIKIYGLPDDDRRYSPAQCTGCDVKVVSGNPDPKHINTSYVERFNLTMRMSMRRFTRLTNAFSKKLRNHELMIAIHAVHYNFVRMHKTLRCSPAMAADLSQTLWSLEDMIQMADSYMPKSGKRGPYKKKTGL